MEIISSRQLLSLLVLLTFALISIPQSSFAQTYDAILTLDPLPSVVQTGDEIVFSGRLVTMDGYVVSKATIYIKDDVDFGTDDILGAVETDEDGWFSAVWTAEKRSSGSWDFYAVFDGSEDIDDARSKTYSITVSDYASSSNTVNSSDIPTKIILDLLPSSAYAGNSITFTGELYANGKSLPNAVVMIYEDDPLLPDDRIAYGKTDANGKFKLVWNISAGLIEKDFDIYAVFDGDSLYDRSRSPNQTVSILKYGGNIQLDPIPSSAKIGEPITFSGRLSLEEHSPEGAIVYIKDEDALNPDDLLATAYVDANGKFSAKWFATNVDEDNEVDIYAVFEGSGKFYRLTTCDSNPTRSVGGLCGNTIKMYVSGMYVPPSSPPKNISGEYIEGFYSLDFTQRPLVVIVPSPDSYSETSKHVVSVKEGILMWKSYLDNSYGGNWDVDFDVVSKEDMFFSSRPDIVVNLITPEIDSGCNTEFYGYATIYKNPPKPVQTFVCISANGNTHSAQQIIATSAHEFIHAMGLGHTWNKQGDLMCSVEPVGGQLVYTCPNYNLGKSKTPSTLNLAGVVQLYGLDGFRNPNNDVTWKSKFISESKNYDQPNISHNNPTSLSQLDSDNDSISDTYDKCKNDPETLNNYLDEDGCPDKKPTATTKELLPSNPVQKIPDETSKSTQQNPCGAGETLLNEHCISDELAEFILGKTIVKTTVEKKSPTQFIDTTKDPKYYVQRYQTEPSYKLWFDENYPEYDFHEALGITKTQFNYLAKEIKNEMLSKQEKSTETKNMQQEIICGSGAYLDNDVCVSDKQEVKEEKQEKDSITKFLDLLMSWFS